MDRQIHPARRHHQQIAARLLDEAHAEQLAQRVLGGVALVRNNEFPGHVVSWRFTPPAYDQSVAILVPDAAPTGFKVIAYNRTNKPDAGYEQVDIDSLLAQSDVVSLHLTLGDETRGFLTPARIARMKKGAILVNTARGALVDEQAMIEALKSGHIRHAALDVFHVEPLKADHPLASIENVTLSAHAAFRTLEASMTLLRCAIDITKKIVG